MIAYDQPRKHDIFFTNKESHVRKMTCVLHAVTIDADFDRQIHNDNNNNNGRNGSCLTWLATSRGEAQIYGL